MTKTVNQKMVVDREVRMNNDWYFTMEDFQKMVELESEEVLPEFKNTIKFKLKKYSEPYDSDEYAGMFMIYKDYETDEEFNKRIAKEEQYRKLTEERERAEFERLSKKFAKTS
jgi:hypothetical protein